MERTGATLERPAARSITTRSWVQVGAWKLHTRVWTGSAPSRTAPIVLVHGFGVSSRYMVPLARRLARACDVYAPDLPLHGASSRPRHPLDIPAFASALVAWMDGHGLERAELLGHSMGAQIVAHAALLAPKRVERLILVGPTSDPTRRSLTKLLPRFAAAAFLERPALVPVVVSDYLRAGPLSLITELRSMLDDHPEDYLPRLSLPSLVVRGERDMVVSAEWAAEVARMLGAGPVRTIEGWGHAVNFSAPEALASIIAERRAEGRPGY